MSGVLQALIGGMGKAVKLDPHIIQARDFEPVNAASATATFTLSSGGGASATTTGNASNPPAGTTSYTDEWMIIPPSSDYECRATLQSGSISSGTLNTWQALSTTRAWACSSSIGAGGGIGPTVEADILIEIRSASTSLVLDDAVISLSAESNSG